MSVSLSAKTSNRGSLVAPIIKHPTFLSSPSNLEPVHLDNRSVYDLQWLDIPVVNHQGTVIVRRIWTVPLFADLEPLSPAVPVWAERGQRSLTPLTVRQQLPADAASPLLHAAVFPLLPAACVRKQQITTCSYLKMSRQLGTIKACDLIRGRQVAIQVHVVILFYPFGTKINKDAWQYSNNIINIHFKEVLIDIVLTNL